MANRKKSKDNVMGKSHMWLRSMIALLLLLAVAFGAVVANLFRLQIVQGEELKSKAVDNQLKDTKIPAQRGTIYDRNHKELARSATVWRVVLVPAQVDEKEHPGQKEAAAECLSQALGLDKAQLLQIFKDNARSYWQPVASKVETDVKDKILSTAEKLDQQATKAAQDKARAAGKSAKDVEKIHVQLGAMQVIDLVEDYKRYYPYGDFASNLLGFTNNDGQGVEGLEAQYNQQLSGVDGRIVSAKTATQADMPFQYEQKVEAQDGSSLLLTIDEVVQHALEKYLDEGAKLNKVGNRACGILMDVHSGEILGMATRGGFDANDPLADGYAETGTFDPNDPRKLTDSEKARIAKLPKEQQSQATLKTLQQKWRNKCVSDTYTPGSVFKMCTASMALEEGIVNEETPFTCTGSVKLSGWPRPIKCWKTQGHGTQTFTQAVCNSCNPQFIHLGLTLGAHNFYKYFDAFGFTKRTGVDLPGEPAQTIYYNEQQLDSDINLAVESFGQNFTITPVQMITACAAVANGGYLVQPHVVKQVVDSDGNILQTAATKQKRQVISAKTSERMRAILQEDAISGTAKNGYIPGYRTAGKTGTSQKTDKNNALQKKTGNKGNYYIASYCGFAPADDPQYALLVFCDEPNGSSYYGNAVSGPIFNKVMSDVLPYLGVEPKYSEEEVKNLDVQTPNVVGQKLDAAKQALSAQTGGLKAKVYGDGGTVLAQLPAAGAKIPQGGTVALFTTAESRQKQVAVPELVGMTVGAVEQTAADAGLNLKVSGAAANGGSGQIVSTSQSIAKGQQVQPGTVVTVVFAEQSNSG